MRIKKSMIIAIAVLGMLSACADKKPKEVKVDATVVDKVTTEMKEEIAAKEAEIRFAKKRVADSLKKVDSLQQVKEHGHAH